MSHLTSLSLIGGRAVGVDSLLSFASLRRLDLSYSSVPARNFRYLTNLTSLTARSADSSEFVWSDAFGAIGELVQLHELAISQHYNTSFWPFPAVLISSFCFVTKYRASSLLRWTN